MTLLYARMVSGITAVLSGLGMSIHGVPQTSVSLCGEGYDTIALSVL